MRVSLIQMPVRLGKVEENLAKVHQMVTQAVNADLAILPELWSCGHDYDNLKDHAERTPELLSNLTALAKENVLHLVTGSLPEIQDGRIFNTTYIIDPHGNILGKYRKIHLFPNMDEDKYFSAGDMILPIETAVGKIGILICFDLRFPELARTLSAYETKLIVVPALWPKERIEHWRLFLQARALENQLFVVGVNAVGKSGNALCGGNSMIVAPTGDILAEGNSREKVISAEIELRQVNLTRNEFPVWRSRRSNLYHINFCFPLQNEQSNRQSE